MGALSRPVSRGRRLQAAHGPATKGAQATFDMVRSHHTPWPRQTPRTVAPTPSPASARPSQRPPAPRSPRWAPCARVSRVPLGKFVLNVCAWGLARYKAGRMVAPESHPEEPLPRIHIRTLHEDPLYLAETGGNTGGTTKASAGLRAAKAIAHRIINIRTRTRAASTPRHAGPADSARDTPMLRCASLGQHLLIGGRDTGKHSDHRLTQQTHTRWSLGGGLSPARKRCSHGAATLFTTDTRPTTPGSACAGFIDPQGETEA